MKFALVQNGFLSREGWGRRLHVKEPGCWNGIYFPGGFQTNPPPGHDGSCIDGGLV